MDTATQSIPLGEELKIKKVAVMGSEGMVGKALCEWFKDAIPYDPPKGVGTKEELNEAEIVFIAVPTPFNEGFDLSYVENAVKDLWGNKVVVIKSTILPGTTDNLQTLYPQHRFIFNPEFLTEATAREDMLHPDRQILGYTEFSYSVCTEIMAMLPEAPYEKIIPAREAEMCKYFNNTWFATKVIFANQMYDLCEKLGIDYDTVKNAASADRRMTKTSHLEIWHKGSRGYGGKCLLKDTKALLDFADSHGVNMSLLKEVDWFNSEVLKPDK